MNISLVRLLLMTSLLNLTMGCSTDSEKGDYIFSKENKGDVPKITVVHSISEQEANNRSLSEFLRNDDLNDVTIYHVLDVDLYNELKIGERVTVKSTGYQMQSNPPQEIAEEINGHSIDKD
ncbi:YobA family protein [Neobacillus mesonae]|nr:YobA family protein [Neobacillus mesonae]